MLEKCGSLLNVGQFMWTRTSHLNSATDTRSLRKTKNSIQPLKEKKLSRKKKKKPKLLIPASKFLKSSSQCFALHTVFPRVFALQKWGVAQDFLHSTVYMSRSFYLRSLTRERHHSGSDRLPGVLIATQQAWSVICVRAEWAENTQYKLQILFMQTADMLDGWCGFSNFPSRTWNPDWKLGFSNFPADMEKSGVLLQPFCSPVPFPFFILVLLGFLSSCLGPLVFRSHTSLSMPTLLRLTYLLDLHKSAHTTYFHDLIKTNKNTNINNNLTKVKRL